MRNILIIVPEEGLLFEAAGIADIFGQANRLLAPTSAQPRYQVAIATTLTHRIVHGRSGLNLLADHRLVDLDPHQSWDTIMVTGKGLTEAEGLEVAQWIELAAGQARRVVSVCAGALILARTGLLDGRRATTHWRRLEELARNFPRIVVETDALYVQDGPIWTSAGASSGFDLTLALVEADLGFELARDVAQDLVMFLRRPGGQSQFSRYLWTQAAKPGPIQAVQTWVLDHLPADLSVEALADRAAMSARNFTRVFAKETGVPPARWVEDRRLEAARQRLELGRESLDEIAAATGLGTALNLRRLFERRLQVSPSDYRQRFRVKLA